MKTKRESTYSVLLNIPEPFMQRIEEVFESRCKAAQIGDGRISRTSVILKLLLERVEQIEATPEKTPDQLKAEQTAANRKRLGLKPGQRY